MSTAPISTFKSYGGQSITFLKLITQLQGSTHHCLSAIPTTTMDPPITAMVMIDSRLQMWVLTAGTLATDLGVQRPNDYDSISNAKVWIQRM